MIKGHSECRSVYLRTSRKYAFFFQNITPPAVMVIFAEVPCGSPFSSYFLQYFKFKIYCKNKLKFNLSSM